MNVTEFKNNLTAFYESGTAMVLEGRPGVGKTSLARAAADQLADHYGVEFGLVEMNAALVDQPNVLGYMIPSKTDDGQAISRYTVPELIHRISASGFERGIILVDELGAADQLTQKALAPLLIERRIGDHVAPEGWWVLATTNAAHTVASVPHGWPSPRSRHGVKTVAVMSVPPRM